jgi:hypothetical protein
MSLSRHSFPGGMLAAAGTMPSFSNSLTCGFDGLSGGTEGRTLAVGFA